MVKSLGIRFLIQLFNWQAMVLESVAAWQMPLQALKTICCVTQMPQLIFSMQTHRLKHLAPLSRTPITLKR